MGEYPLPPNAAIRECLTYDPSKEGPKPPSCGKQRIFTLCCCFLLSADFVRASLSAPDRFFFFLLGSVCFGDRVNNTPDIPPGSGTNQTSPHTNNNKDSLVEIASSRSTPKKWPHFRR